jgi:hypothetical protein
VPGRTALVQDRPYRPFISGGNGAEVSLGLDNPTDASSSADGHSSRLVNDGDAATYWAPQAGDTAMAVTIDLERVASIHKLVLTFPQAAAYGFVAETTDGNGQWQTLAQQPVGAQASRTRTLDTAPLEGRRVRVRLLVPAGAIAGLSEVHVVGQVRSD